MDEEHILSADQLASEEDKPKSGGGVNKALLGIIIVLLLVISGGGAYYFGNKSSSKNSEATPTQAQLQTETLGEDTQEVNENPQASEEAEVAGAETTDLTPTTTPNATAGPTLKIVNPNLKTFKLIPTSTPTPTPTPTKTYIQPQKQYSLP